MLEKRRSFLSFLFLMLLLLASLSVFSEQAIASGGGSEKSGGGKAGESFYVQMPPLLVPMLDEKGAEQIVTIVFAIQLKQFDDMQNVRSLIPKIQDSVFASVYDGLNGGSLRKGHAIDIFELKKFVRASIEKIIDKNSIADVLIQTVAQRTL